MRQMMIVTQISNDKKIQKHRDILELIFLIISDERLNKLCEIRDLFSNFWRHG